MDFETFTRRRERAALSYCQGDAGPVKALSIDATFFGPDESPIKGPEKIKSPVVKITVPGVRSGHALLQHRRPHLPTPAQLRA